MTHPEHGHDESREAFWMRDQEAITRIRDKGAQEFFDSLADQEQLSDDPERPCACIDERVGGPKVAIPGSGILQSEDEAFRLLKEAGVTSLSSHADCGAAVLAFNKLSPEDQARYGSADGYAQEWAKAMAARLGVPYAGHAEVDSPGQHVARAVYYDASGSFRADAPNIPRGFTVSRKYLSSEQARQDLLLAIRIATGDHGFAGKFNGDEPLLVVPISDGSDLAVLREEISEALEADPSLAGMTSVDAGYRIPETQPEEQAA
jgi:hypothetical protein